MPVRNIINIDEEKCNGCGQCVVDCAEAAIQIVNGKAKLVKEIYCDGLGACIGGCPTGALTIVQKEAEPFDEEATERHVQEMKKNKDEFCGCPGTMTVDFTEKTGAYQGVADFGEPFGSELRPATSSVESVELLSRTELRPELTNWPVQLKLVATNATFLNDADLLLAADCTAFSTVNFHSRFIKGRKLLIACPKLDDAQYYYDKLTEMFRENSIKSVTVVRMEVPCCGGLIYIVKQAIKASGKDIPLNEVVLGIKGDVLRSMVGAWSL